MLTLTYNPVLNYAMQQNQVPAIRKLTVANSTETHWQNVEISISGDAAEDILGTWTQTIEALPAGASLDFDSISLPVKGLALAAITERLVTTLEVLIKKENETLDKQSFPLTILAFDQWAGLSVLPEMLAAYITPNHERLPEVLHRASDILQKWTGNPGFDEYQSRNPDRVRKQMAAIYEAISELQILYCSAPPSFEATGQRIRLCDGIFAQRLGNCLDVSLLYAACLEAVGIRPIVVVITGHAFAGGWLVEESFADAVNDDPALLTKRLAAGINEIALIEATSMNKGNTATFDDAATAAAHNLVKPEDFQLFLDVKRCRLMGIRPLPQRSQAGEILQAEQAATSRDADAPRTLSETLILPNTETANLTKQQLWERKLLDLTLRNNLLNLRLTKSVMQFASVNPATFEDALAAGTEFQVLPRPANWDIQPEGKGLYINTENITATTAVADEEFKQKRLRSFFTETELNSNLTGLYRSSRSALEENGANTLFIALGFLKWYETPGSEVPRFAPLLLAPVEIVRRSARQGYVVRSRDEETVLNITLLEKLRQDFGLSITGLEQLPRDESGVDVNAVFTILRRGIMHQARWDVEEQVVLGTFSFNKFILWNDIHNNSNELAKNNVVASLLAGKLTYEQEPETEHSLDKTFLPSALALPIAVDSSQLEAVISSGEGKSFVLHGPPGTGKSQTITNMISNALFAGKTVLFVAQKKAALEVVEKRLDSIGLGAFCLELHSNKAKKSEIVAQLKAATEVGKKQSSGNFEGDSTRLAELRTELNEYVQLLHQQWHFGFSLYEALSRYSQLPDDLEAVAIPQTEIANLTTDDVRNLETLAAEMQVLAWLTGSAGKHPLQGLRTSNYNSSSVGEAGALLKNYVAALEALKPAATKVATLLKIDAAHSNPADTEALAEIAAELAELPSIPASLLRAPDLQNSLDALKYLAFHGNKRVEIGAEISKNFNGQIFTINAAQILSTWTEVSDKWFLPRWQGQKKVVAMLQPFSTTGKIEKETIPVTLRSIIDWQNENTTLGSNPSVKALAGFLWQNDSPDWDRIISAANAVQELAKTATSLSIIKNPGMWREHLAGQFEGGSADYISRNKSLFLSLKELFSNYKTAAQNMQQTLKTDAPINAPDWYQTEIETANLRLANLDKLKDWTAWNAMRESSENTPLQHVAEAFGQGHFSANSLTETFRKSLYQACVSYIMDKSPELTRFNSAVFEDKIARFQAATKEFEALTRQELYARLAAKIPDFSQEASTSSEPGLLNKAIRSNARGLSIRRLFDSIPNLLPRLTPCMLMSPISVAQYFDASGPKFDLVIFDEASQMPTCEAIGAMARGKSVIVVGDPKQMPPTNFFTSNSIDEDNLDIEDLESILDDCLALSISSRYLLWHYRSRHESLIAFSNAEYYENKLLTFPSMDDLATKVTAVDVPGFYDKGKTRQNPAEAKAIVAEIMRRLADPNLAKRSLGVVTFSVVQQNLIEDLLTEEFRSRPDLEAIATQAEEPLFVKNLENVQGDERDVILFSICYGPDEKGAVSHNFGPLNREGGWRRLNVAVTRARYEMQVFATLKSDQIDLSRTQSEGVAGLKDFLAYAEKGKIALSVKASTNVVLTPGLEGEIAKALEQKGYEIDRNIGTSGYRVDLGIRHPEKPGQYLLGIRCDGDNYKAGKTARDREIVQPAVLKGLGWKLKRVWSADWWENKDKVVEALVAAAKAALEAKDEEPEPEPIAAPKVAESKPEIAPEPSLNKTSQPAPAPLTATGKSEVYKVADLAIVSKSMQDNLLLPKGRATLEKQIREVLAVEAPIMKTLLCKRIAAAWGLSRAGARIAGYIDFVLGEMVVRISGQKEGVVLWNETQHSNLYENYRLPANDEEKRDASELPLEEIANAVKEMMVRLFSLPEDAVVGEVGKIFGYARLGRKVEEAMRAGVEMAVGKGFVKVVEGRVVAG